MRILGLLAFASVAIAVPVLPVQAQLTPDQTLEQTPQTEVDLFESPSRPEQLPPDFGGPLEVDQRQNNEFFAPPQPAQPAVENRALPVLSSDELLGPPPGSQTSDEVTPGEQLSIPIR